MWKHRRQLTWQIRNGYLHNKKKAESFLFSEVVQRYSSDGKVICWQNSLSQFRRTIRDLSSLRVALPSPNLPPPPPPPSSPPTSLLPPQPPSSPPNLPPPLPTTFDMFLQCGILFNGSVDCEYCSVYNALKNYIWQSHSMLNWVDYKHVRPLSIWVVTQYWWQSNFRG